MVKGATGWLFDQLRYHPDFWLPSIKELRYLNRRTGSMENVLLRLRQYRDPEQPRALDPADVAFLEEAATLAGGAVDLDRYAALFRFKGQRLSGDISPGYCLLKEPQIAAIAARFPGVKVLLLVRDPVARACSHIAMAHREGRFNAALLEDVAAFRTWFDASLAKKSSFATGVTSHWRENAPNISFRFFLFDDIEQRPDGVRREILSFLGGDSNARSSRVPVDFNRKATQAKIAIPPSIRAVLIEELSEEIRACGRTFGGVAEGWCARYGV